MSMSAGSGKPLLANRRPVAGSQIPSSFGLRNQEQIFQDLPLPNNCLQCLRASQPICEGCVTFLRIVGPFVMVACQFLYRLYSVIPSNELKLIYGVALCFCGGEFCASIAAVECFRRTGGDKLIECAQEVAENVAKAHEASLQDDKELAIQQLPARDYYKHKAAVVLKAVDPDVFAHGVAGLYQGFLGLIVSLKFQFAWTVALACSIADCLRKPAMLVVGPCLAAAMPREYHKWINQIINITLKVLALHFAWKLQELVSSVQSGLLGASLVGQSVIILLYKGFSWASCGRCCKEKKFDPDNSYLDEAIGLPLAVMGIWFQISHNFSLPFPFNLALLPLRIVEEVLRFCITWFPVQDTQLPARR